MEGTQIFLQVRIFYIIFKCGYSTSHSQGGAGHFYSLEVWGNLGIEEL